MHTGNGQRVSPSIYMPLHCLFYSQQVESDSNYLFVLDLLLRLHAITNLRGA